MSHQNMQVTLNAFSTALNKVIFQINSLRTNIINNK